MKNFIKILLLSGLLCLYIPSALADHINLEEGLPVELEDPYPTEFRNVEIQQYSRFDLEDEGRTKFPLVQRLEYGFAPNAQFRVTLPVWLGSGFEEPGLGDVDTELFYNLNQESKLLPATAISGRAIYPTNQASKGVDMAWKLMAVKKVGKSAKFHYIGVNGEWKHNFNRTGDERPDTYKVVAGYYTRLGPNMIGIIDYVRELNVEKDKNSANFIEIGFRNAVTPLTVVGIGFGVGVDDDSPRFRTTLSYQHSLTHPFYPWRGPREGVTPVLSSEKMN